MHNLHNHFVINSVSYVDGKKYEQRRSQYAEFRAASDKLCREYGLSVVEQPKAKEPARYARMREAIDQACEDASTAEDFHRALYRQGYIFGADPNRKYAMIRARDGGRAVRLYRLGEEYDLPAIDDRLRGNYLLYGPRLYELKHPPRQYTPKRYRPTENRSVLQIFFEVFFGESQMHRLYLYYCYQLGILPKKPQPRINRPELERIWKDTEKILAEHAFVHDHKFPSLQAIVDYRKGLSQRMETLAAQRAEIVKQMRRKEAPPELADQRMALTCQITKLRKEDKIAEGAIQNEPILYRAYYTLAITTGLRRGELCALQWRDITGACEMTVRRSRSCASGQIVESDTKSHRERIVTIPLGLWELLMALRQQQMLHSGVPDREQPIFTDPDGHVPHPDTFTRHLRKLYKKCGLSEDYHLHTLRHFYATYLLQEGTSKQVAASLLGHADTAFLERTYCHPQDAVKLQAANLMQDLLNSQNPCYVAFMKNKNRKAKKAG